MNMAIECARLLGPYVTALAVVFVAFYFTKSIKRTDVVNGFDVRLDNIAALRFELQRRAAQKKLDGTQFNEPDRIDADHFFSRFFTVQRDQFLAFRSGYIEESVFKHWMEWRRYEYQSGRIDALGLSYTEAWNTWSGRPPLAQHAFVAFMNDIHRSATDVEVIVRQYAPPWHRRLLPR